ncbi:MAG: DUF4861 domain-containing protein [Sphingobacteriales bacterium]|nr:MAG: DUF4861 domain-containing protein [Sphingobacteriales bacterium]
MFKLRDMKKRPGFLTVFLIILLSLPVLAQKRGNALVKISNPLANERQDELVVLTRKFIERKLGAIGKDDINLRTIKGTPVLLQFDDLDSDGTWDEVAFLYNFKIRETVTFRLARGRGAMFKAVVRAHVRQRRKNAGNTFGLPMDRDSVPAGQPNTDFSKKALPPFLTEGPAWENDKVGFRIYMDVRNTKDIWGKITPVMMMDTVGAKPGVNYHEFSNWGMDILAVGKSLGAGSLALLVPVNGKDTLIRLGGVNMGPVIYQKVADGPLRAIFRMHYPKWQLTEGLPPVSLTEEISIWGGQYFYQSKVTVRNAPAGAKLVTGIVNLKSEASQTIHAGAGAALYTFDQQSENKDSLGLAVAVPNAKNVIFGETPKASGDGVLSTYTAAMPLINNTPVQFRFYSGWIKSSGQFATQPGFGSYLTKQTANYAGGLVIK